MMPSLAARLADLAARGETTTYGSLAADLGLTGPGTIARLTAALEALMEEDAAQGRPFRAALVNARGADLPARGFFEKAASLGRAASDPAAFIRAERQALQTTYF